MTHILLKARAGSEVFNSSRPALARALYSLLPALQMPHHQDVKKPCDEEGPTSARGGAMLLQALRTPVLLTIPSWHAPLLFAVICFKHQSPGLNVCCAYHPVHKRISRSVHRSARSCCSQRCWHSTALRAVSGTQSVAWCPVVQGRAVALSQMLLLYLTVPSTWLCRCHAANRSSCTASEDAAMGWQEHCVRWEQREMEGRGWSRAGTCSGQQYVCRARMSCKACRQPQGWRPEQRHSW